ncbi:uncharacterized protein LOC129570107 [Sitodiplosis mosellana]|uniref:uncharacterized protein LOC129570107 n=1 Tax=Sitodiplosis mosellana TaxID=263140 RepID=UPI0024439D1C|nr:uncharacterized protein LOC129570107 [Sitodiplosis mosellana]
MGKIKRERQKFHIGAEKKADTVIDQKKTLTYKPIKAQLDTVENIFSGINIQLDNINKFEEFVPPLIEPKLNVEKTVQSIVDVNSTEQKVKCNKVDFTQAPTGKHQTKKEKIALKHQKLMEKLDVTHKARMEHKQKKQKSKRNDGHLFDQTLSAPNSEFLSLLTPAAVKSSNEGIMKNKNVFSIPLLNDDLPALDTIFKQKMNQSNEKEHKITKKSKNIGKRTNSKKTFVANYEFLRKAMMAKKKQ